MWCPTRRELLTIAAGLPLVGGERAGAALAINPRSSWAADRPPRGPLPDEEVRFLLVHHSASRNGHTGAEAPNILRLFYDFHTGEKGWNDIAYNFVIDGDGGIWEGREGSISRAVAGDATGGNQGFSQLVCLIGNYDVARPSEASLDSLVSLLAWLADRHDVSTAPGAEVSFVSRGSNLWPAGTTVTTPTITGHRTMSRTSCPGDYLHAYVSGGLIAEVDGARSAAAAVPSTNGPPSARTSSTATTTRPPIATQPSTPSPPSSTSTVPLAVAVEEDEDSTVWMLGAVGLLAGLTGGLLLWRRRRLGE